MAFFRFGWVNLPSLLLVSSLSWSGFVQAAAQEYVREYDYVATEYDSKYTSKIAAVDGMKQELLNELGTYVQSVTKIHKDDLGDAYMTKDIVQLTAGILSVKLMEERWNRVSYYVKGNIQADPDDVLKSLEALRSNHKVEEALRASVASLKQARAEIGDLRQKMAHMESMQANEQRQLLTQYQRVNQNMDLELRFQKAINAYMEGDFDAAFKTLKALADQGLPKAQARLGRMYQKGILVERQPEKAVAYYEKARAQGFPNASGALGFAYQRGLGVGKDAAKAYELYQEGVARNSSFAKAKLAQMYMEGEYIGTDYERAYELAYEASRQDPYGFANALMGEIYLKGYGVDQDFDKARGYFEKGVEKGNGRSYGKLGNMYIKGQGVDEDYHRAYTLLLAGAKRKNGFSMARLGHLYEKGLFVDEDENKAFQLYKEAAELGSVHGFFMTGRAYRKGIGTERDKAEAKYWYRKAARLGHPKAQRFLDKKGISY